MLRALISINLLIFSLTSHATCTVSEDAFYKESEKILASDAVYDASDDDELVAVVHEAYAKYIAKTCSDSYSKVLKCFKKKKKEWTTDCRPCPYTYSVIKSCSSLRVSGW